VHLGAEPGDLPAVAREREELAVLVQAIPHEHFE
jgi:hypothetical protein